MKRRRLPPLKALRAFEAAAKYGSFVKAADVLGVTSAAVSHQIKILEEYTGHLLFERLSTGLALTPQGQSVLPGIVAGFEQLEGAMALLRAPAPKPAEVLVVSALPSLSQEWLIPRLVDFRAKHPEIDVLIQTDYRMVDLEAEEVDVAIRFGRAGFGPNLQAELLAKETVMPVCSPSLLRKEAGSYVPRELTEFTLLNSTVRMIHEPWMSWDLWLEEAGLEHDDLHTGTRFSDPLLILRSAVAARGMVLGRSMLIRDHLHAGRLVAPFADWVKPIQSSYFFVTTTRRSKLDRVARFRDWILNCAPELTPSSLMTY